MLAFLSVVVGVNYLRCIGSLTTAKDWIKLLSVCSILMIIVVFSIGFLFDKKIQKVFQQKWERINEEEHGNAHLVDSKEERVIVDDKILLKQKSNIFEHLFYEFQMYLRTYLALIKPQSESEDNQFLRNMMIESHCIHLRNLIEFFNCDTNSINMNNLFAEAPDLSFDDGTIKAKQAINKSVEHLTKERYETIEPERALMNRIRVVIPKMFCDYMVERITICLSLLEKQTNVKPEVLCELKEKRIQDFLQNLKNEYSIVKEKLESE